MKNYHDEKLAQIKACLPHMQAILDIGGHGKREIMYAEVDKDTLELFSDFEKQYHHIREGCEMFFIFDRPDDILLYTVDVSADSVLTAYEELMKLIAAKF